MNEAKKDGPRRLVLVVDDEEGIRFALERHLKRLGYDVAMAASGPEALTLAERLEPAVIVTDVHMPGMDGHALLRRLHPLGLPSSVIFMSGRGELDDAISALRQGAVDYLKKPWTVDELSAAIGRAIELFDALSELSTPSSTAPHARAGSGLPQLDAAKLVEALAAKGDAFALPPLAPRLAGMRDVAAKPNRQPADLLPLIERDAVLVASVFQLAEEIPDAPKLAPGDLGAAAAVVGYPAIEGLIETIAAREAFPISVPALRTLHDRIWRFAVSRALAMQGIAGIAEPEVRLDVGECYLAGLWLDVGAMYLLSAISEALKQSGGGIADLGKMNDALAAHHAVVGASILARWNMPSQLVDLARAHHAETLPKLAPPLWCAAALGSAVAVRLAGAGDPTGDRDLRPELLARCAYTLGVGDTSLRRLTKSLTGRADRLWPAE